MKGNSSVGSGGPIDHDKSSGGDDGPLTRGRIAIVVAIAVFGLLAVTGALPVQFGDLTGGDDEGLDIVTVDVADETLEGDVLSVSVTVENSANDTVEDTIEIDAGALGTDTVEMELDADTTETETVEFETEGDDAGEYTVSVNSGDDSAEERIEVVSTTPDLDVDIVEPPEAVREGDPLDVTASVTNVGDSTWSGEVLLNDTADDETLASADPEIPADSTEEVTLTWDEANPETDSLTVAVWDEGSGTIDTDSADIEVTPEGEAFFNVTAVDVDAADVIEPGGEFDVTVDVVNEGDESDFQALEVEAGNFGDGSTLLNLDEGDETTETFTFEPEAADAGEHTIKAATENTEAETTVTVEDPAPDPPESSLSNLDIAGQGEEATLEVPVEGDVSVDVENIGEETDSFGVNLEIGDAVEEFTLTDDLDVGTETVTFEGALDGLEPETYSVTVSTDDDEMSGEVTVEQPEGSEFVVQSTQATPGSINPGDEVSLTADIENVGQEADTQEINVFVFTTAQKSDEQELTLAGGETDTVSFTFDDITEVGTHSYEFSTDDDDGSGSLDVEEDVDESEFLVDIIETNSPVEEGQDLEVTVEITNEGDEGSTQQIWLNVLNQGTSESVTLQSDESTEVTLTVNTEENDAGNYTATVESDDDTASETVTVEEGQDPASFDIRTVETNSPVEEGQDLEVTVDITNEGDEGATQQIWLNVLNQSTSESVTLQSDESTEVTLTVDTEENDAGNYTATVESDDDTASETVTVGAHLQLDSISAPDEIAEDEALEVDYDVENVGGEEGTESFIRLYIDGLSADNDTDVTVGTGEKASRTLVFSGVGDLFKPGETIQFTVELIDFGDSASGSTDVVAGGSGSEVEIDPEDDKEISPSESIDFNASPGVYNVTATFENVISSSTMVTVTGGGTASMGDSTFDMVEQHPRTTVPELTQGISQSTGQLTLERQNRLIPSLSPR